MDKMERMDKRQALAFEQKVRSTIEKYALASKKEKVLVACSGGKDSTAVLYILNKLGYDVEAISIDLHIGEYSRQNIENVKKFCKAHKIRLHLVDIRDELGYAICDLKSGGSRKKGLSSCTVCGVVKRWVLNRKARELKADRLATGHNLNDESETVLMNLMKGNPEIGLGMGPKSGMFRGNNCDKKDKDGTLGKDGKSKKSFVQRIKPLYFCSNDEVRAYSEFMDFPVIYEPCPCSADVFRRRIRNELNGLEKAYPKIRLNLVRNFLKILPDLQKRLGDQESKEQIGSCELCGEPSRKRVCRLCSLVSSQKSC